MPFLVIYKNCYGLSIMKYFEGLTTQKYSYKNCYGLSIMKYFEGLTTQKYSYKICYGLSSRKLYKNCYGLSINNCVEPNFRDALSYKNCYGLSCRYYIIKFIKMSYRTKIVMVYLEDNNLPNASVKPLNLFMGI